MNRYKLSKAGINANEGIQRFGGNAALYEDVINHFPEDKNFNMLCDAIQAGDVDAAFAAAHALKGIAGNLSFTTLYNHVFPLTEELRAKKMENADELLKLVAGDYEVIIAALEK